MIPESQATSIIDTTAKQYWAMKENGWHLPPWKAKKGRSDTVNTGPFMHKVRTREYWCPKIDQVNWKEILFPPPKRLVWEELQRLLKENAYRLGIKSMSSLKLTWMLQLVGTLDPRHQWFQKGFKATKSAAPKPIAQADNWDGFYDGLLGDPSGSRSKRITAKLGIQ